MNRSTVTNGLNGAGATVSKLFKRCEGTVSKGFKRYRGTVSKAFKRCGGTVSKRCKRFGATVSKRFKRWNTARCEKSLFHWRLISVMRKRGRCAGSVAGLRTESSTPWTRTQSPS